MADITNLLRQIKTARRGEDVRDSIHDAIQQCYEDGTYTNAVDLEARNMINDLITGKADEVLLFPTSTDQIAPTYANSPSADTGVTIYGDMDLQLNRDPSTFDKIRVYYQVVRQPNASNPYCSTPIVLEFSAEDFVNTTSVVTGYNFGASNQHLRIRRMNIERNSTGFPSDPTQYIVKDSYYWAWDGSESSNAETQPSDPTAMESNTYPVGAILKIVGVSYTNVAQAVDAALEDIHVGTIEDDTLVL